jgi:predicted aspartyl protease
MAAASIHPEIEHPRVGFGLFGSAFAWLVHLIAASIIAEWGCVSGLQHYQFLGITAIAWSVVVLSIVALLVASVATWAVYRLNRRYQSLSEDGQTSSVYNTGGTGRFLARVGLWSSALFVFIIAAQSFPILYFLSDC